jgi:hypothetical protein
MARYVCKIVVGKGIAKVECLDTVTGRRHVSEERWDPIYQAWVEAARIHPDWEITVLPEKGSREETEVEHE